MTPGSCRGSRREENLHLGHCHSTPTTARWRAWPFTPLPSTLSGCILRREAPPRSGERLEHLDPVVGAVGDEDGAVGTNGDALYVVELPAALAPPCPQEGARGAEALDAPVVTVDDVNRAVGT